MRTVIGWAFALMAVAAAGQASCSQLGADAESSAALFEQLRFDYENAVAKFEDRDRPEGRLLGGPVRSQDTGGHPAHVYLQRFEDFAARTGHPEYGLIANQDLIVLAGIVGDVEVQEAAVKRLVERHADTPGMDKFVSALPARPDKGFIVPVSAAPRSVHASIGLFDGFFTNLPPAARTQRVLQLLSQLDSATSTDIVRIAIAGARLRMAQLSGDAALEQKYYEELITKYPHSPQALQAKADALERDTLSVGNTAPDFEAVDAQGVPFKLSDYRGKVVLLDFWGFWCAPCMALMPHTMNLVRRYEGQPFAVIGINSDKDTASFERRAQEVGINFRNALEKSTTGPIPKAWNVKSWPTVYVIDPNGVITAKFIGGEHEQIEAAVASAMAAVER